MDIVSYLKEKDPHEREFHQAVSEVMASIGAVLEDRPDLRKGKVLKRLVEPERMIVFRVPWQDDAGEVQVNRGIHVEMNSAIGPYKGGLRFHPSVNQSILKFLAFQQVFKNALSTLPLGGGAGGSDFDPKGKSDMEVMRFCQSYMTELYRHIGPNTDVPSQDIGVGAREVGYLFGMYRKLKNKFAGAMSGKGLSWGGSVMRPEATGYGCVYFAAEMLQQAWGDTLADKVCLVSGSGNVAQHTAEKLIELGAKVITLSDSSGYIHDPEGIDSRKLQYVKLLKNVRRGRIGEYAEKFPEAVYTPVDATMDYNPLWRHRAQCAFPCATENEIRERDAYNLINNNVKLVCEGANMPCSAEAVKVFGSKEVLFAPGKAANAGGAIVSGLEMVQNSMRLSWSREEVDVRLKESMTRLHTTCLEAAEQYGMAGDYLAGANIAGFQKVVDAMLDQGLV